MIHDEGSQVAGGGLGEILETLTSSDVIGALSNIADIGEHLERGVENYTPEEAGTLIKVQSERVARLVDALLITRQIESGQRRVLARPQILRPALEEIVESLQPLSERYATRVRLSRGKKFRPVLVDNALLSHTLRATLEGVIRTTVSRKIQVDTVSHDDRLFLHITDKDASFESQDDNAPRTAAGGAHAIAIPSFYVANSLIQAMGGEFRIAANKNNRHIDLVFPHSVQLSMEI